MRKTRRWEGRAIARTGYVRLSPLGRWSNIIFLRRMTLLLVDDRPRATSTKRTVVAAPPGRG